MSRPLRIEYPGAWYHLMNRGRRKEIIFEDNSDRLLFISLLKEAALLWDVRIAAFCLMDNHYHLLVQTPQGNLARFMRHLNGVYTQRFNRLHEYDGQLFRGRYKSILVAEDSYLLELVRYIHRNPFRAGVVDKLAEYRWSSHHGYLSKAREWDWLHKKFVLGMLERKPGRQQGAYLQFVGGEDKEKLIDLLGRKKWPSVFGDDDFISWVKERFFQDKVDQQVPDSFQLAPDRELIIMEVCRSYGVAENRLFNVRRGQTNEARDLAIYLCRMLRHDVLKELGEKFGMKGYSPAGRAVERTRKRLEEDKGLGDRLKKIKGKLLLGIKVSK